MDTADLGHTGLHVSRLAFGTGTHGWGGHSRQTRLGLAELARLLRLAHDLGVTFWDVADGYGSHRHVREALRGLPREEVVVTTKTAARSAADAERAVERYRREMGTDYLDVVLLHCMTSRDWPPQPRVPVPNARRETRRPVRPRSAVFTERLQSQVRT